MSNVVEFDINRDVKEAQPIPKEVHEFLIRCGVHNMNLSERVKFIHFFDEDDYVISDFVKEFILMEEDTFFDAIIYGFYVTQPKIVTLGSGYYYRGHSIEGVVLTKDRSKAMVIYDDDVAKTIKDNFLAVKIEYQDGDLK